MSVICSVTDLYMPAWSSFGTYLMHLESQSLLGDGISPQQREHCCEAEQRSRQCKTKSLLTSIGELPPVDRDPFYSNKGTIDGNDGFKPSFKARVIDFALLLANRRCELNSYHSRACLVLTLVDTYLAAHTILASLSTILLC